MSAAGGSVPTADAGGNPGHGVPLRGKGGNSFVWSSPSPSPGDVAGLERLFPEVIDLPTEAIDRESEEWTAAGLILRSLSKWVPPEAITREFRRAGLSGRIDIISLAHRTFLVKFETLEARSAVLLQPWVVNGQPLVVAAWRPDFVPAEDALSSALLWIRLPNLPLEYWNEETLRSIVAVAGEFVAVDDFTKQRRRGSYARACVRVDLSRPLRPGARIRAHGSPFWQQFAYEHVDCICPCCGSVHLTGPCSSSSDPESPAPAPRFGPWMAALRQRRPSSVLRNDGVSSGAANSGVPTEKGIEGTLDDREGWMKPGKVSRRRTLPQSSLPNVAIIHAGNPTGKEPCRDPLPVPVTVHQGFSSSSVSEAEAGVKVSDGPSTNSLKNIKGRGRKNLPGTKQSDDVFLFQATNSESQAASPPVTQRAAVDVQKEIQMNISVESKGPLIKHSDTEIEPHMNVKSPTPKSGPKVTSSRKVASNPFSLLGSDRWAGVPKVREDANPVMLKRARPEADVAPRVIPKYDKGKGKGAAGAHGAISRGAICSDVFLGDPQLPPLDSCAHLTAVTALKEALLQPSDPDHRGDVEMMSTQSIDPSDHGTVEVSSSLKGPSSMDMTGSMDGAQSIPQSD